ncbi:MAG: glycosyltransferase family 2 protein, partial [Pseudomonadota bacterium]
DINLNSISWWTEKHNGYASREAIDLLNLKYGFLPKTRQNKSQKSPQAALKRFLKENLYRHLPTSLRSFLYFMYRYIFRFGFLDGRRGLYFHFLQGFWYRMLVDSKIMDIEQYMAAEGCSVTEAIIARTGYDPLAMVPSDRT